MAGWSRYPPPPNTCCLPACKLEGTTQEATAASVGMERGGGRTPASFDSIPLPAPSSEVSDMLFPKSRVPPVPLQPDGNGRVWSRHQRFELLIAWLENLESEVS